MATKHETKPGWLTTEWWVTLAGQALALLVLLGVVNEVDVGTLQGGIAAIIGAVGVIAINCWVIVEYIRSRTSLKIVDSPGPDLNPDKEKGNGGMNPLSLLFVPVLGIWLLASPAQAQQPQAQATFWGQPRTDSQVLLRLQRLEDQQGQQYQLMQQLYGQNQQLIGLMQQQLALLHANQQRPQQYPNIIIEDRKQELPIGGRPQQEPPIGGRPQQELPIGGGPQQQPPIGGRPQQELPINGGPQQGLPVTPGESKPLPNGGGIQQELPTGYQRYTVRPMVTESRMLRPPIVTEALTVIVRR